VAVPGGFDSFLSVVEASFWSGTLIDLMFLSLAELSPDRSDFRPQLAQSWEFSEDRRELTFHLRDDIKWWDGVPTTAEDVQFSFELHRNPDAAWSAISWLDAIERVEILDSLTLRFFFRQVYPYQMMDATVFPILPKHILGDVPVAELRTAEFNRNPVGNGMFRFKEWKPQEYVRLVANEHYYKGRPYLDPESFSRDR